MDPDTLDEFLAQYGDITLGLGDSDGTVYRISEILPHLQARLQEAARQRFQHHPAFTIPIRDILILGNVLLDTIFGSSAQSALLLTIRRACSQTTKHRAHVLARTFSPGSTSREQSAGHIDIASFCGVWARVQISDPGNKDPGIQIDFYLDRVRMVRIFDRVMDRYTCDKVERERLLDEAGVRSRRGVTVRAQLIQYLVEKLGLTARKLLTDTIRRWRPLADLVDCFGNGVLLLLASQRPLRDLHRSLCPNPGRKKCDEDKENPDPGPKWLFRTALEILADLVPGTRSICSLLENNVLQPIVAGERLVDRDVTRCNSGVPRDRTLWEMAQDCSREGGSGDGEEEGDSVTGDREEDDGEGDDDEEDDSEEDREDEEDIDEVDNGTADEQSTSTDRGRYCRRRSLGGERLPGLLDAGIDKFLDDVADDSGDDEMEASAV